jgi:DNA end-binding protein Ku
LTPSKGSGTNLSKNVSGDKVKPRSRSLTIARKKTEGQVLGTGEKESGKNVKRATPVVPHPGGSAETVKAGRPFWSGNITIGLVNVPVRLHTMVRDRSVSFRLLHKADGQPLRYDRVCTKDDRVIPWTETVRGYEVRKGEYLVFEPEELKAIMPESNRKIRIEKFVFYLSLDPVYFDTSYFLTPDRSEEAYSLLVTALQDLGRAAIGTITLRTKEYPVVIHAYGGGLVLTTLHYADEVTLPPEFITPADLPAPKEAELTLAKRIITDLSGDFSMADFHDRYREAVMGLIEKKLKGEKIVHVEPHPEEAKELMQALKETLSTLSPK